MGAAAGLGFSGIMQFFKLFFPILYKITKLIVFKLSLRVCEGVCNQVSSILGRQFYIQIHFIQPIDFHIGLHRV